MSPHGCIHFCEAFAFIMQSIFNPGAPRVSSMTFVAVAKVLWMDACPRSKEYTD